MTTHQFSTGTIIKHYDHFYKILGEAGEMRFISCFWEKENANEKNSDGLKFSDMTSSGIYTIQELNAYGYVPVSPEGAGLVEEWEPKTGDHVWFVEEQPTLWSYDKFASWYRVLLKSGLLKPTREAAEAAYRKLMGE